HLVHDLAFVVPCYRRRDLAFYGLGLKLYDFLVTGRCFGRSRVVFVAEVARLLPTVCRQGLRGGVVYHDGQFDDARLLIHLIMTAADHGAVVLNYAPVTGLIRVRGGAVKLFARDVESGAGFDTVARVVVNAAGPFCDDLRRMMDPTAQPLIAPSQGSHVV